MLASRIVFFSTLFLSVAMLMVLILFWSTMPNKTIFTLAVLISMSSGVSVLAYNLSVNEIEQEELNRKLHRSNRSGLRTDTQDYSGVYPQDEQPLLPEQERMLRSYRKNQSSKRYGKV